MNTGPPGATPVTNPEAETVAIAVLLDAQPTMRPVRTLPLASCSTAVNWNVAPTTIEVVAGLTVTDATATSVTVTEALPLFPSEVAVIVTGPPAATPVTTPV